MHGFRLGVVTKFMYTEVKKRNILAATIFSKTLEIYIFSKFIFQIFFSIQLINFLRELKYMNAFRFGVVTMFMYTEAKKRNILAATIFSKTLEIYIFSKFIFRKVFSIQLINFLRELKYMNAFRFGVVTMFIYTEAKKRNILAATIFSKTLEIYIFSKFIFRKVFSIQLINFLRELKYMNAFRFGVVTMFMYTEAKKRNILAATNFSKTF